MKRTHALGATLVAAVLMNLPTLAAAQASAPTRDEVKAQTKQAVKNRATVPAGEGIPDESKAPDTKSTQSRAERKAQTQQAVKDRTTVPAGEGVKDESKAPDTRSTKTRVERKAETRKARADGQLAPAGESATPAK
jgi:hypothetical protein